MFLGNLSSRTLKIAGGTTALAATVILPLGVGQARAATDGPAAASVVASQGLSGTDSPTSDTPPIPTGEKAPDGDAVLQVGPFVDLYNKGTSDLYGQTAQLNSGFSDLVAAGAPGRAALQPVLLPGCDLARFSSFIPVPVALPVPIGTIVDLGCAS